MNVYVLVILIRLIGKSEKRVDCKIAEFSSQNNINLPAYRKYIQVLLGAYIKNMLQKIPK